MTPAIFIGWEPREADAFRVCRRSIAARSPRARISTLELEALIEWGLYRRPTSRRDGRLWDDLSEAPMSTEFAISRFFLPFIEDPLQRSRWALFMDCDMLVRGCIDDLFALADPAFAIQAVKHQQPAGAALKMDGQAQLAYPRKNWSSVMLWNLDHPAHRRLRLSMVNSLPGRDLHRFCWLRDDEIGELPPAWNHLVGIDPPNPDAKIAHFTLGVPSMAGYEGCEFADEWRAMCAP